MLQNIAVFLISALFSLYIGAVLVRFLLAYARADFHNPYSQALVKVTNPVLVPLRRFIPAIGKVDTSSLVLAFILKLIGGVLITGILGKGLDLTYLLPAAVVDVVRSLIWIYMVAMIVQAVMSWLGDTHGNPIASLLHSLTAPILRPIRKVVPMLGMIDLSPLVAILALQVCLMVLVPLPGVF
uniref:Integral membrane protein YggT, involved in response to extracytoplasmic stress (Osmotic shock) n=1 Tax=uncultured Thiotrichaceae bacterium TaxID=298394 RepID=A0A6S6UJX2_9GAMM|nr:MAG: Integral membrane protein YggT, involved in response to extracytoplasmic stress (osmotic shock) [uncultured Thiotrichaceae bacterium]